MKRLLACVYSTEPLDGASINMSISTDTVITVNASYVTLNGLTVTGTRGNGRVICSSLAGRSRIIRTETTG